MRLPLSLLPDPFESVVWRGLTTPITRQEVQQALDSGCLLSTPLLNSGAVINFPTRQEHIERIAHFVVHGWGDSIDIEPSPGDWPIQDGNHRLAAAFFRGDPEVSVVVFGIMEHIREMFGDEIGDAVAKEWDEV